MQSKEEIIKLLHVNGIPFREVIAGELEYNREIEVNCIDHKVSLEWWSNIGYIFIGDMQLPFDKIKVDGCWPNRFKLNINLYYKGVKTAIIPVKEH